MMKGCESKLYSFISSNYWYDMSESSFGKMLSLVVMWRHKISCLDLFELKKQSVHLWFHGGGTEWRSLPRNVSLTEACAQTHTNQKQSYLIWDYHQAIDRININ